MKWTAELGPREYFEVLLFELEQRIVAKARCLRAGVGSRRGLSLGLFGNMVEIAGCLVALERDAVSIRPHLADAVSYGLEGLAAPPVESYLKVGNVTVTFSPDEDPRVEEEAPRFVRSGGTVPANEFALVAAVVACVGTPDERSTVGAYDEQNYREAIFGEELYRELRGLKAWLRGNRAEALALSQQALREGASPGGEANLRAIIALGQRYERDFRKALDRRLKVHRKVFKARPVAPRHVISWDGLMLSRFAREAGWRIEEQPFLPVWLLDEEPVEAT